jgi:hypothetical protein
VDQAAVEMMGLIDTDVTTEAQNQLAEARAAKAPRNGPAATRRRFNKRVQQQEGLQLEFGVERLAPDEADIPGLEAAHLAKRQAERASELAEYEAMAAWVPLVRACTSATCFDQ